MSESRLVEPDLDFIREVKKAGGDSLKKCYQCATCSMVCNLSPENNPFPRKEMIWANWGMSEKLIYDPDVWLCYQCNDCTTYCPRGARPGDVLAGIRSFAYKHFAFPTFMGKALAAPKALPLLVLTPAVILFALILLFAQRTADGVFLFMQSNTIDFDFFLPHSAIDVLFVSGSILMLIFATISLKKFWRGMQLNGGSTSMSFIRALILTLMEIGSHARFRLCEVNRPRAIWHMLLLYGFVGAFITTGAVFIFIFIPHYLELLGVNVFHPLFELPLDLPNLIKILGGLSGLALVIGGAMLIIRRWTSGDDVGTGGYADQLFLWVMFLTGLTGMLSWLIRISGAPMLAYASYFVHIVCVFVLLLYLPYSKFAHMVYRTLAIVYSKQLGREPRVRS